jgi:hypothetical protein
VSAKITAAPPTEAQLRKFEDGLKKCLFVEHAAILAGIPTRSLTKWIVLGRQGHRDFVAFVDLIDRISATQAEKILDMIQVSINDGNLDSAKWMYKQKFAQREVALTKKWIDLEEIVESEPAAPAAEEDLEAAERRLLGETH